MRPGLRRHLPFPEACRSSIHRNLLAGHPCTELTNVDLAVAASVGIDVIELDQCGVRVHRETDPCETLGELLERDLQPMVREIRK